MILLSSRRTSIPGWVLPFLGVAAGVVFGGLTSAVNVFSSGYGSHSLVPGEGVFLLQVVSKILDSLWAWALLPFAVGFATRRPVLSAIGGAGAVLGALIAYYVSDAWLGATDGVQFNEISLWARAAVVGAPVLGVLGALGRRRHRLPGLLCALVAPVVMASYVAWRPSTGSAAATWANVLVIAGAIALGALALAAGRQPRRPG